jgi:4-hydroxy-3-methylbut-2-enyl diphosphate reductase
MAADPTPVRHQLVICTPLLAEYAAVRWGIRRARSPDLPDTSDTAASLGRRAAHRSLPGADSSLGGSPVARPQVLRTGMGPTRSRRAAVGLARDLTARPRSAAVVVAGVAGALTTGLSAGDVVVASELHGGADPTPTSLPHAAGLARALRAAGLPVRVGPVLSTSGLGGDRAALHAETGAVAVDLESAFLASAFLASAFLASAFPASAFPASAFPVGGLRAAPVSRFAVVRVVVDTPSAPLVHPRTVPNGVRALRVLARVAAALPSWAAAPSASRPAPAGV